VTSSVRRRYESALRREQAADTSRRIVAAGCEILRSASVRDWRGLTVRAVAERAGVNERTVYRHFVNERGLRDAVMQRLEEEVGIELSGMGIDDIADVAARIFEQVSTFPLGTGPALDATLDEADRRQRCALVDAVTARAGTWPEEDRTSVAAMFDVLWGVASYERLVVKWRLERDQAIRVVGWVIGLVADAVSEGRRP
jgi:AcrR family transcriptional regulator